MRRSVLILMSFLICVAAYAGPRDRDLIANPGFEAVQGDLAEGWEPVLLGYDVAVGEGRDGGNAIHFAPDNDEQKFGARQIIEFDPPVKHTIVVSGWSRCEGAEGIDYSFWLDIHYADGTPLWGQRASFNRGTHDWEYAEHVVYPEKPIASIEAFALFREMSGEAWMDDLTVRLAPFRFDRMRVADGLTGPDSIEVQASTTVDSRWRVEVVADGAVIEAREAEGRSIRESFHDLADGGELRISATDTVFGERITQVQPVRPDEDAPGYGLWVEPSMARVMPTDLPADEAPQSISLLAARNEYESAQIVLLGGQGGLEDVRLSASDLRGPDGASIDAEHMQWRQVGYVWIEDQWPRPDVRNYAPTWWPDPLLPVESFDVDEGWTQPVWVTVYVPPGTPPGDYSGAIEVTAQGHAPREVPVGIRVIDFEIPVVGNARNAFALHPGYLEWAYGKENVTAELRRAYGDYLLGHRINPDDITRAEPPVVDDIAYYRERGLTTYNLISFVEPRGDLPARIRSELEAYTPEMMQRIQREVDPVVAELRERDLLEGAYVYSFDECKEDFYPTMREYFGMVQERWGVPTFTTAHVPLDPEVLADLNIDWICPHARRYRFEAAERCREAGFEVWSYTCCGPRYPFTNILADDPLIAARIIGWQVYQQKLDGFLFWGVNIWSRAGNEGTIELTGDPRLDWNITTGGEKWAALHGDGTLLYPLDDGPMGCIRLANVRDGFEDYEYLHALGKRIGIDETRGLCEPVTKSLSNFTLDPDVVLARREALADALAGDEEAQP
ncbi:MAG: DUF4091 domain-containing protein [Armatimonadia bacterium]|nr:DUF4091 domain-containing protein [Armatimonadia bacterium]